VRPEIAAAREAAQESKRQSEATLAEAHEVRQRARLAEARLRQVNAANGYGEWFVSKLVGGSS
jgi:hypothetical protein